MNDYNQRRRWTDIRRDYRPEREPEPWQQELLGWAIIGAIGLVVLGFIMLEW